MKVKKNNELTIVYPGRSILSVRPDFLKNKREMLIISLKVKNKKKNERTYLLFIQGPFIRLYLFVQIHFLKKRGKSFFLKKKDRIRTIKVKSSVITCYDA